MIRVQHKNITVTITQTDSEHTDKVDAIYATEAAIRLLQKDLLNYCDENSFKVENIYARLATQALNLRLDAQDI